MGKRLQLYKSCVCSILTWGADAWHLNQRVVKMLNGANASMVSIISGKTPKQEASRKWRTFDLIAWIRARRLQWAGEILRLQSTDRKIKQAAFEMYKDPQDGDLLMDVPKAESWRQLLKFAADKEGWQDKVRALKQPRLRTVNRQSRFEMKAPNKKKAEPTASAKYRARDSRQMLFHSKAMTVAAKKAYKPKKSKTKPRQVTDAERAAWARAHWEENHGKKANQNASTDTPKNTADDSTPILLFSNIKIHGHHANAETDPNQTMPPPTQQMKCSHTLTTNQLSTKKETKFLISNFFKFNKTNRL